MISLFPSEAPWTLNKNRLGFDLLCTWKRKQEIPLLLVRCAHSPLSLDRRRMNYRHLLKHATREGKHPWILRILSQNTPLTFSKLSEKKRKKEREKIRFPTTNLHVFWRDKWWSIQLMMPGQGKSLTLFLDSLSFDPIQDLLVVPCRGGTGREHSADSAPRCCYYRKHRRCPHFRTYRETRY